jgi:uncharacterized protein YcbK (DUF882 family)
MVRKWHAVPATVPSRTAVGLPMLVLDMVNTGERVELSPMSEQGGFSAEDIERASHALRDPRGNDEHEIDPRLLDLAYRVQRHFGARSIRVLSAFRVPHGRSNHGRGKALDLVIPGTSDDAVAQFVRTLGFVGVGLYPRSGFIHLDSRQRSYFWIDASGPGQHSRQRPVLSRLAAKSDAQALANGEAPPDPQDNEEVAEVAR